MTPAAILEALTARGARLVVIDGKLAVTPRAALDDPLRAEIRAQKAALLAILSEPPPDPTETPGRCPTCCTGAVWWRWLGDRRLHCAACAPCPDNQAAAWYLAPAADEPAALFDGETIDAYLAASSATIRERLDLERRCERLAADPAREADYHAAARELVGHVRETVAAYRRERMI